MLMVCVKWCRICIKCSWIDALVISLLLELSSFSHRSGDIWTDVTLLSHDVIYGTVSTLNQVPDEHFDPVLTDWLMHFCSLSLIKVARYTNILFDWFIKYLLWNVISLISELIQYLIVNFFFFLILSWQKCCSWPESISFLAPLHGIYQNNLFYSCMSILKQIIFCFS